MGILYKSVNMQKFLKKQFVLERLMEKGITHSQQGKPIQECDYSELKFELVILAFKEIDEENENEVWF